MAESRLILGPCRLTPIRLGEETLILRDYAADGRRIPETLTGNDRSFQHIAIVVSDLQRSVRFYRDGLGFIITGEGFNCGGEQELLTRVAGSRVRITSFRGAKGPGIELLRLVYRNDLTKPYVGYAAGFLLLVYITFEAPFSGMSLNPSRSVASALPARSWKAIWIYFAAPIPAMLLAVKLFQ